MSYWRDIWKVIESDNTSTRRDADGRRVILDSKSFRGMSPRRHQRVIDMMANQQKIEMQRSAGGAVRSLGDIRTESARVRDSILSPAKSGALLSRVQDTIGNYSSMTNVSGQDTNLSTFMQPNVWIDPGEAASVYSQGGIASFIIRKKSKAIEQNGTVIHNPRLTREQLDAVNESATCKTGFVHALSDGARDGLAFGGALAFPFFKKDSPLTLGMTVEQLVRYGVIEKNCLDRYVVLDRWNTVVVPNWNPTARDFLEPLFYFIPYLGSDVCGQRCARIVPLPQAGYWGAVMTMGWGTSDITSWYQALCNYEQVITSIPNMIRQMSLLVRTFNTDVANALNGAVTLDHINEAATLAVREASSLNPINMDVIGDLKAIQRDFNEVPALTRLVRQDLAARANLPEEKFWSSERGAFSSGDLTEGLNEGEWDGVKHVNSEVAKRAKKLAMIEIINTLGKDRDIMAALPYTTVEVGSPVIEDAEKRATIIKDLSESAFSLVASGAPVDVAVELVMRYGDKRLVPTAEVMDALRKRQKEADDRARESGAVDLELKKEQLKTAKETRQNPEPAGGASSVKSGSEKKGYSPLEQKMHERTRGLGARREGIGKAEGKKL